VDAKGCEQFPSRVFEPQHEQQQNETDLRTDLDEALGGDQGQDPALSERKSGGQIERNGGDPEPACDPGKDRETDYHSSQLEQDPGVLHRLPAMKEFDDLFDAARRANDNEVIPSREFKIWLGGREGLVLPQHRDD
jgi:hypothetical protein